MSAGLVLSAEGGIYKNVEREFAFNGRWSKSCRRIANGFSEGRRQSKRGGLPHGRRRFMRPRLVASQAHIQQCETENNVPR
jgi:hypothetical protein